MNKSVLVLSLFAPALAFAAGGETIHCRPLLTPYAESLLAENPLLQVSTLPFGAIPFDRVQTAHFKPAFETALAQARRRVDAIRADTSTPTFANTIEALEALDEPLAQVGSVFSDFLSMKTSPELQELSEEINPLLSKFSNDIYFDAAIFRRVKAVFDARASLGLTPEQTMVLQNAYRSFVRNGALLDATQKARVAEIDTQLSTLGERYSKNNITEINAYELVVTDRARLAGLPEDAIAKAAEVAQKKGKPAGSYVFTMQAPSYGPLITYASDRALREEMWWAVNRKSTTGETDNRPLVVEITRLKAERARIMGFPTHAAYTTDDRMAKDPATVTSFLTRLANVYRPAAAKDLADLKAFAGHDIEPWDAAYYSEKLREQQYSYSEEELRPYFKLENVIKGVFFAATQRYGVTFHERKDIPTWDPAVTTYEVRDADGSFLSLFYSDPFPRDSKRAGAWMNQLQAGGMFAGEMRRPHVVNVGNYTEPVGDKPALLTIDEVTTIFHEMGHGLHGMLSKARYRSVFGPNVAWDFVELPSQMNERWVMVPEVLDVMARHYITGERIPDALVEKVKRAETFQAGLVGLRQISLGMLDFAWYNSDISAVRTAADVEAFEEQAMAAYRVVPRKPGTLMSTSFGHIFAGGYSAGYYSYKWADVLAADTFDVFLREGVFNLATATRFRREILERGGSEEAAVIYRRWRGGDPDPDALLRREGLLP
jgi:peptidyl-dipeptidase Dcp